MLLGNLIFDIVDTKKTFNIIYVSEADFNFHFCLRFQLMFKPSFP